MTHAELDRGVAADLARDLHQRAQANQSATVEMLTALGTMTNGYTVDAGALETVAHEQCSNDTGHGPGTCVFPDAPDGLCGCCAAEYVRRILVAGDHLSIDVCL